MRTLAWLIILLYLILIVLAIFTKKEIVIIKIMKDFYSLSKLKKIVFILVYLTTIVFSWLFRALILTFLILYCILILFKINNNYTINCPNCVDKEDKDLFILSSNYIKISDILKITIRNLYKKSKKRAFMILYNAFNKNKKIDINTIEKIFFRYLFRIDTELAKDIIDIINGIEKRNKNKIFKIAIISKLKELCKKLAELSLNQKDPSINFKIVIENWKIKTRDL